MGRRQIAQLSFYDYITGITLGSIAAELAISKTDRIAACIAGMLIYAGAGIFFALLTDKFLFMRKLITGRPLILYKNGQINVENLSKSMMDVNEFLSFARIHGYFDLNELDIALLETNGQISFRPMPNKRTTTCEDLNIIPKPNSQIIPVILNGKILKERLTEVEKDENWLLFKLSEKGNSRIKKIVLATCDENYNITIYQ